MSTQADATQAKPLNYRRYKDGDHKPVAWQQQIFNADHSHKCPTYIQSTPPCQGSCPSGEDIRGYLNIVRGIEKPPAGMPWQEYAFRRSTDANPFPSMMGRVCPAPCQDGCNRNEVEDFVGINSLEQYVGDWAIEHKLKLPPAPAATGKSVAVVGGGPAGTAAAMRPLGSTLLTTLPASAPPCWWKYQKGMPFCMVTISVLGPISLGNSSTTASSWCAFIARITRSCTPASA